MKMRPDSRFSTVRESINVRQHEMEGRCVEHIKSMEKEVLSTEVKGSEMQYLVDGTRPATLTRPRTCLTTSVFLSLSIGTFPRGRHQREKLDSPSDDIISLCSLHGVVNVCIELSYSTTTHILSKRPTKNIVSPSQITLFQKLLNTSSRHAFLE
jgi:hypothetical protein